MANDTIIVGAFPNRPAEVYVGRLAFTTEISHVFNAINQESHYYKATLKISLLFDQKY